MPLMSFGLGFNLRLFMNSDMNILVHVFGEQMFAFLLGMFQGAELLGCKLYICPALEAAAQ